MRCTAYWDPTALYKCFVIWPHHSFIGTARDAWSLLAALRKAMVFKLLSGRFWDFSPCSGHILHQWGWNLHGPTKFHHHRCRVRGTGLPKLKILLKCYKILEYKHPTGVYPLRDFLQNLQHL